MVQGSMQIAGTADDHSFYDTTQCKKKNGSRKFIALRSRFYRAIITQTNRAITVQAI